MRRPVTNADTEDLSLRMPSTKLFRRSQGIDGRRPTGGHRHHKVTRSKLVHEVLR
jgi:hypothetical protein